MENFIMIPNRSFNKEIDIQPDALFVYAHLFRNRLQFTDTWMTVTNIFLVNDTLNCTMKGGKRKSKETVRDILVSLKEKGFIICDVTNETQYHVTLYVTFPIEEGFVQIKYKLFDLFNDSAKFYIYCYIDCFGEAGRVISDGTWTKLTGLSKETVRKRISEMNSASMYPRIYKFSGTRINGTEKQETNEYFTRPNDETLQKWNNFYDENGKPRHRIPNESSDIQDASIEVHAMSIMESQRIEVPSDQIEYGNWTNKKVYLTEEDFYLYWKYRVNNKFADLCDRRLKSLEGKRDFTVWMAEGKARLAKEIKKAELKRLYNAVSYYGEDQYIEVGPQNIDEIDFNIVENFCYYIEETRNYGKFAKIAGVDCESKDEISQKVYEFIVHEYKNIVRQGLIATTDLLMNIRNSIPSTV
jgi:hypothetical protein